ncbi:hypothetical protein CPC08DRAFT_753949 [Agrocybe pediades]|nr:hypothetical protein CPC08DRAFT_753949 [Agrocybe pediades]
MEQTGTEEVRNGVQLTPPSSDNTRAAAANDVSNQLSAPDADSNASRNANPGGNPTCGEPKDEQNISGTTLASTSTQDRGLVPSILKASRRSFAVVKPLFRGKGKLATRKGSRDSVAKKEEQTESRRERMKMQRKALRRTIKPRGLTTYLSLLADSKRAAAIVKFLEETNRWKTGYMRQTTPNQAD